MRRWIKVAVVVAAVVLISIVGALLWVRHAITSSLPQLEGDVAVADLGAAVTIERDDLGVPTIHGSCREDVARGLGFVHAQERFFQMDLLRRQGAGELSELFGPAAVEADRAARLHRFRSRAKNVIDALPDDHRRILSAYVEGINTGLEALDAVPFEYLLLRLEPAPWLAEDSLLVLYAMFFELNDSAGRRENARGLAADLLDPDLLAFLSPLGTSWDAPLDGGTFEPAPMPQVATTETGTAVRPLDEEPAPVPGSNNWAVAGSRTADGRAILANDMHLGLGVPNTWYRVRLVWPGSDCCDRHEMIGVTLPGSPALVAGSNTRVAWGFTNSYGDWTDLVILEPDGDGYRTPNGALPFTTVEETIEVAGQEPVTMEIRETIWGPVIDTDHLGRERALRWTAHDPHAADVAFFDLEHVGDLDAALATAATIGMPSQNFVCADSTGRIGWTITGAIPNRVGFSGRVPTSWADGENRWDGWVAPADYPKIVDPSDGILWTANNRTTSGEFLGTLGDGGYDLGARAMQIRDRLLALPEARESDMLAIQLDDRALFLERWRELALEVLTDDTVAGHPDRMRFRDLVRDTWTGHASTDSHAFRLVRTFRLDAFELVYSRLMAPCLEADERFSIYRFSQWEDALWWLITERPDHFIDPELGSWEAELLAAVDATMTYFTTQVGNDPALWTWGKRNTLRMQHPLSRAVPQLSGWLDMTPIELPGDSNMPRVQGPTFGASERFAVSPGRESEGYFHMPGGQSGHPQSPHYRAGHDAWVEGDQTPFLPGNTVTVLTLVPAER
jgi:penicillin amidase